MFALSTAVGLGRIRCRLSKFAVGKPAEQVELVPVHPGDNLNYYRRDGVHYVPKLTAEDLTI